MNEPTTRLLFVYNADSGLFNTLSDIGHKIFSPHTYNCQLCALTHGYFTERSEWRTFIESLVAECTFLHRDEFRRRYPANNTPLPAVFRLQDNHPVVCLEAAALEHCTDLDELQANIRRYCLCDEEQTDSGNA